MGTVKNHNPNTYGLEVVKGEVKILGIYMGENIEEACERTWGELEEKIKNTINLWRMRTLSFRDKAQIIKLLLSKINHILMTHHLPTKVLNNLNNIITRFIWKAKVNKVAHKTIIAKHQEGGLNLINIATKKETFRLKIIKKTLGNSTNIWVDYFREQLGSCGKSGIFNLCQTLPQNHYNSLEPFMREVMIAWKKVRPWFKVHVKNADHILQQPLCHNIEITSKGKPILSQFFEKAGVISISDIINTKRNISCDKVLTKLQNNKVKHKKKNL